MELHDAIGDVELTIATDDGAELGVTIWGDDHPAVVFIPGLGSNRHIYLPLITKLPRALSLAIFDPRGIGTSQTGTDPMTMERLAADVAAVIHGVSPDPMTVFGASMGGMVAAHVALEHPGIVDALFLSATTAGGSGQHLPSQQALEALMGKGAKTPSDGYRMACTVLYSEQFQQTHPDFIDEEVMYRSKHPVAAPTFRDQRVAMHHHDVAGELPNIKSRTYVLHGKQDVIQPFENGAFLAKSIPGARFLLHEEAGHLYFHEDPEWAADALVRCLADVG